MTNTNVGSRVSALFDTHSQAESAINDLRAQGVTEPHFSIITRQDDLVTTTVIDDDAGGDFAKGTLAGASAGALFGIAAALIPGVGPFITAGTLLSSALGSAGVGAVAGAFVGGTTMLISTALTQAGYDEAEANYYGSAIEQGGTLVTIDTGDLNAAAVRDILARHGGRTAVGAS